MLQCRQERANILSEMPLPSKLTYNDLSGDEIKHVLVERFKAKLDEVPYLQKHITLPRVRMDLSVILTQFADQDQTETPLEIFDQVEVLSDTVDASRRGLKPDQIRESSGLPIPTPIRDQFGVRDEMVPTDNRQVVPPPTTARRVENARMTMANGAVIDRTGDTPQGRESTVVTQDFGPAGLSHGNFNRPEMDWRNTGQRDGGRVAPPRLPDKE
jgi:hypothetical protein